MSSAYLSSISPNCSATLVQGSHFQKQEALIRNLECLGSYSNSWSTLEKYVRGENGE